VDEELLGYEPPVNKVMKLTKEEPFTQGDRKSTHIEKSDKPI
jgi:hypothetical protein